MTDITISGKTFSAPSRYAEGHVLTAGEASALNQTFHENLRNNFAKKVKEAEAAGAFDPAEFQTTLDAYAETYQFGVRPIGGGGSGAKVDPVESEARSLAKSAIAASIKARGQKIKDFSAEAIGNAIDKLLAKDPSYLATAKERVAQKANIAKTSLEDLDLEGAPTPVQASEPVRTRRKAA